MIVGQRGWKILSGPVPCLVDFGQRRGLSFSGLGLRMTFDLAKSDLDADGEGGKSAWSSRYSCPFCACRLCERRRSQERQLDLDPPGGAEVKVNGSTGRRGREAHHEVRIHNE